ncbi:helix-turn-helix transcriptional regulator [Phenylobacterium sp.]|uniref:helix-turn-helix domain-containing protein n=1 Tax=Phenylobacterium sp. TaxID=1871053 RepID=UPI00271B9CBB|nr:helix-turn-helix transcriptional regulator [Phenylobacterium sp.]MDO8379205.1 helix-turn-helix transcriptional regulator [Phenylobacterium sp.]
METCAVLTPECCRAGRALLDWSLKDLAEKSGVAFTTISQFENGRPAHGTTQQRLAQALERNGVKLMVEDAWMGAVLVRRG